MAYNSTHSGPEIDAAVQMLSQIQDARDSTKDDLTEVKVLASQVDANAVQVQSQADSVSSKSEQVAISALAVQQAHTEVVAASAVAEDSKDSAVAAADLAVASRESATASEQAASQSATAAGISEQVSAESAAQISEMKEQVRIDSAAARGDAVSADASAKAAALLIEGHGNKRYTNYAAMVADTQTRNAIVGIVDADSNTSLNGWYSWDNTAKLWNRLVEQPARDVEARFGLLPVLSYDAKNPTFFGNVSGFVRTVVDGKIQFAPDGSTASVGYFSKSLASSERLDPAVSGRLRYRIRRTTGNLNRLYVVQIRDSTGASSIYYPYSATPNNLVDGSGWTTYEVDLSRKPDGTAWAAGVLLDQILVPLSLGNGNSAWQLDWLAVGAVRSDAVYSAELKRQIAVIDSNATKRNAYGFIPVVEALGGVTSFWTGLSGFTVSAVGGYTVFTPDGITTSVGYVSRTLSAGEKFDPSVNSSLKYRIKKSSGAAQRTYLAYLRDSSGVGHYYLASTNPKYSLVDRTDWVTYEVNIGTKPDGSSWAGELIEQVWLSLTKGTEGISWTVDWLAVGKPVNNQVANSDLFRITEKVDEILGQQKSNSNALIRLKAALYHPLHSIYIGCIGDSITFGVGAENASNTWVNLLHRWLGESFANGVVTQTGQVSSYTTDLFVPLDNPFIPGDGPIFHITNNGERVTPVSRYNVSAYTSYYYPFDKTASGAAGNYNQPITFDLTGDNLTVVYCAINTADPDGSIVELRGNGVLLGSFSYYGPESFSKLAEITFPFGQYKMTLTNKSLTNQFRLEGFRFKKTITVANDGISGSGTGSWLPGSTPLNNAIARKSEFVTVMLGTNDRVGKSSYIVYLYLARIVKALMDAGKDVILMAANATTAAVEAPNGGRGFGQREVAAVTKLLADELGLAFIDNHQATVMAKVKGETWTADGLHPNDYGYGLMFDNIRSKILGL